MRFEKHMKGIVRTHAAVQEAKKIQHDSTVNALRAEMEAMEQLRPMRRELPQPPPPPKKKVAGTGYSEGSWGGDKVTVDLLDLAVPAPVTPGMPAAPSQPSQLAGGTMDTSEEDVFEKEFPGALVPLPVGKFNTSLGADPTGLKFEMLEKLRTSSKKFLETELRGTLWSVVKDAGVKENMANHVLELIGEAIGNERRDQYTSLTTQPMETRLTRELLTDLSTRFEGWQQAFIGVKRRQESLKSRPRPEEDATEEGAERPAKAVIIKED